MYAEGHNVNADEGRAAELFGSACDKGVAAACTRLGNLVERGRGVVKILARAFQLHKQGCDGGDALGCVRQGVMTRHGKGLRRECWPSGYLV